MPRDRNNRREHRGFGFVTFETEAAVARVANHGAHHIKGSVIAIDAAVPRRQDGDEANLMAAGLPLTRTPSQVVRPVEHISPACLCMRCAVGPAGGSNDATITFHVLHSGGCCCAGANFAGLTAAQMIDLVNDSAGPARHASDRNRNGYKPY